MVKQIHSDAFAELHYNKFLANWQTWRTFRAMSDAARRTTQLGHMRKQMRNRAYQYAEARGWNIVYTESLPFRVTMRIEKIDKHEMIDNGLESDSWGNYWG